MAVKGNTPELDEVVVLIKYTEDTENKYCWCIARGKQCNGRKAVVIIDFIKLDMK